jgi:hypothetical protein
MVPWTCVVAEINLNDSTCILERNLFVTAGYCPSRSNADPLYEQPSPLSRIP